MFHVALCNLCKTSFNYFWNKLSIKYKIISLQINWKAAIKNIKNIKH